MTVLRALFESATGKRQGSAIVAKRTSGETATFRSRATYGVALTALLFVTPFALTNFLHGRELLALGSLAVVAMLTFIAWAAYRGFYSSIAVLAVVVPVIVLFLALAFHQLGIIGALWCYPAVIAFYFMLPERPARMANLLLLLVMIPHAWYLLTPAIAARVTVTLIISTLFAAIFVRIFTRQQVRLERSEEKRREGMAGISHELRTPLATLNAQVDAMLDGIRPTDRPQLQVLSRSLEHISALVDDLYLLALADVGELVCRRERVRWDLVIDESIEAASHQLEQRGISLQMKIDRPVTLQGDPRRLRQILDNLLENCSRYARDKATVTVSLHCHQRGAELSVSDNGPGVSSEALPHLFERFYRADSSRSRASGGAGLGLALIKALAEAHGGSVGAAHAPQGGLRVVVTMPCKEEGVGSISRVSLSAVG